MSHISELKSEPSSCCAGIRQRYRTAAQNFAPGHFSSYLKPYLTGCPVESIRSKDSRTFLRERQKASSCIKKDTVPPFALQFCLKSSNQAELIETLNFTRKLQAEFIFTWSQKETRKHSTKTKKSILSFLEGFTAQAIGACLTDEAVEQKFARNGFCVAAEIKYDNGESKRILPVSVSSAS